MSIFDMKDLAEKYTLDYLASSTVERTRIKVAVDDKGRTMRVRDAESLKDDKTVKIFAVKYSAHAKDKRLAFAELIK